jgi:hypothetical protein
MKLIGAILAVLIEQLVQSELVQLHVERRCRLSHSSTCETGPF